jgi:methylphosphotriester-DNA--protein-cysteine methyltransferase
VELGVSERHLRRVFREAVGIGPKRESISDRSPAALREVGAPLSGIELHFVRRIARA